jgi:hypothetical protein
VVLESQGSIEQGLTSLAVGTDQLFAEICFDLGVPVKAVIPLVGYERFFTGEALGAYQRLIGLAQVVSLPGDVDEQRAFLEAGRYVVDHSDLLVAVWDGLPAAGTGGTAHIVAYARTIGRDVIHLDPINRTVSSSIKRHN